MVSMSCERLTGKGTGTVIVSESLAGIYIAMHALQRDLPEGFIAEPTYHGPDGRYWAAVAHSSIDRTRDELALCFGGWVTKSLVAWPDTPNFDVDAQMEIRWRGQGNAPVEPERKKPEVKPMHSIDKAGREYRRYRNAMRDRDNDKNAATFHAIRPYPSNEGWFYLEGLDPITGNVQTFCRDGAFYGPESCVWAERLGK